MVWSFNFSHIILSYTITIKIKIKHCHFFFICSDNPVWYKVGLGSDLSYENYIYTCRGAVTLKYCNTRFERCLNQQDKQIAISCKGIYCQAIMSRDFMYVSKKKKNRICKKHMKLITYVYYA